MSELIPPAYVYNSEREFGDFDGVVDDFLLVAEEVETPGWYGCDEGAGEDCAVLAWHNAGWEMVKRTALDTCFFRGSN